ncbi:DUF262 domain-containing protein [Burkholderia glumae]|uniref:DUF262 domain-containing protein n=1 Tax=Burkholderia glumae TaxID=337 RepID=UPI00214F864C|nr:DUF262 domain-containing HNH endonuclease family protein [Burkholderia glumae]UVS89755.1 DUF262 domain-containing protein [Burkholderia glumae]
MAKTLNAQEQPIQKIFSDDYVFRIPDYQRPYAWTVEQARELLEDVLAFTEEKGRPVPEMPTYFLGSVVLIKGDGPTADVVDGQQRLTTLTILLSVIRANVESALQGQITKRLYEEGDTFAGTEDRYRLTLRQRDAEFFQKYIQRPDGLEKLLSLSDNISDSQQNIRDNARFFQQRVAEMNAAGRVQLAQFILQRCFLVVVSTPDEDSAYRIFSVLNSRGLDLSATDILKARIIGGIIEGQRDGYTKKWEDAEEDLGREDFNALFGHIRTIYRKVKPKESLLRGIEEYVPEVKTPAIFIDEVLLPMSLAYAELTSAGYAAPTLADPVNEHLRWLNRLEFNDWIPPAIAFTIRYRNDSAAMELFMSDLERLAYFMLVTSKGINTRLERFGKLTSDIEAGRPLSADDSALQLTVVEQHDFYERIAGPIYADLSAKARTPVILRLDSILSGGGARYDYPVISVEHILPQSPRSGSQWLDWFPDNARRAAIVHRLGNLALLTRKKNSQASNWDFERKKDSYFRRGGVSPFVLTTQVLNEHVWNDAAFNRRQEELVKLLEKHWRLESRKSPSDLLLEELGVPANV